MSQEAEIVSDRRRLAGKASQSLKAVVFNLLMVGRGPKRILALLDHAMISLIFINIVSVALETVPAVRHVYGTWLFTIDAITISAFTLDYLLRLWLSDQDPAYRNRGAFWGRALYLVSPLAVIDLISILPFYITLFVDTDLRFLLLFRLLRLLRLSRYSTALLSLLAAFTSERRTLGAALLVIIVVTVFAAGVEFLIEQNTQPDKFGTLPDAIWWAIVTITTLGYGDVTPITPLGKLFSGVLSLFGIAICAVPAGIMASAFLTEIKKRDFVVNWRLVAHVPLFAHLDAERIAEISSLLEQRIVPANTAVVTEGEKGDCMYFVLSGQLEAVFSSGRSTLNKGAFFGEMALLDNSPRTATIIAQTERRLLCLMEAVLRVLLDRFPEIRATIANTAKRRAAEQAEKHDHAGR
ncbi:MAG: ion transporter [Alphaproteobacteria bacterium]|nr:ion transporter [Alphaproteobacteria bacterium]